MSSNRLVRELVNSIIPNLLEETKTSYSNEILNPLKVVKKLFHGDGIVSK